MANIKFYLSKKTSGTRTMLSVRFYAGVGVDFRASSRIYVPSALWNQELQQLIVPRRFTSEENTYAQEAQRQIDDLAQFIFNEYAAQNSNVDKDFLPKAIAKFYGDADSAEISQNKPEFKRLEWYLDNYPIAQNLEPRTAARYAVLKRIVERYSEKHHPLYLHNLSVEDLERFEAYLRSGEDTQRCDNTIGHKMKCIRAVCNWARKRGEMQHYPFDNYRIKAEVYGTPNFLTLQERDAIYNTQIENPSLAVQRDIFIFQCHIGCRISDLYKLTEANITQDGNFIQYIQEKMRRSKPQTVRVPLTDTAKEIIERYRHRNRNNRLIDFRSKSNRLDVGLFPFISEQRYNDAIKDILRLAGINRVVLVYDPVTSKNTPKQICDIASSHLARRTFMANVFKLTKSERITSSFTGHTENSKAFSRYTNVDDELKLDIIKLIK